MRDAGEWASWFARKHGLTLRIEPALPGGVPAYKYSGPEGPVVVLDSQLSPERRHFSLAHEAAHILLNHEGEVLPNEEREANELAAELLLPDDEFASLAHLTLRELKAAFPHASYEAIARRKLAYVDAVLTVLDDGAVTRRVHASGFAAPSEPTDLEWDVVLACYRQREDISRTVEELSLAATYVDSGPVERVLLIVEAG